MLVYSVYVIGILSHVEDWEYLQIEKKEGVRLRKQKKVRLIEERRRCD